MGVSLSGSRTGFGLVRQLAVGIVTLFVVLTYLYGPPVSTSLHDEAISRCNDHAEGNFRSFRLSWHVGIYPHWTCADASRPMRKSISLGWWTNPF